MTNEAAEIIAELFNGMSKDNKAQLPLRLIDRMIRFMTSNGYHMVNLKWQPAQDTTPPPSADEDQKLLRARVANLEIALHGFWSLLQLGTPTAEREAIDKLMTDHFQLMVEQGASGKPIFERL